MDSTNQTEKSRGNESAATTSKSLIKRHEVAYFDSNPDLPSRFGTFMRENYRIDPDGDTVTIYRQNTPGSPPTPFLIEPTEVQGIFVWDAQKI